MISSAEIKVKAGKKYLAYLQSIVEGVPFTEIIIFGDKRPNKDYAKHDLEITDLVSQSKEKRGYGYTIKFQTTRKKDIGIQDLPVDFIFQTESDFLKYLHKENEVAEFRKNCTLILSIYHELKEWVYKYPNKVIKNKSKWNDILKVCRYFKKNPIPNKYIRELPIDVHTKFIEENKGILRELLDILIKEHIQDNEKEFEKRFNLKYEEPFIRFRILDEQISRKHFSGIDDLTIPISQFEKLNLLPLKRVFIVENKMNVLTFPIITESIVVFGSGYGAGTLLKNSSWLNNVELFYWGDLDIQGFEILSQFKSHFSHVKSILMDEATFKQFENAKVKGKPSNNSEVLDLTEEQQRLYTLLKNNDLRLEQEKIRLEYVKEYIEKCLFNM